MISISKLPSGAVLPEQSPALLGSHLFDFAESLETESRAKTLAVLESVITGLKESDATQYDFYYLLGVLRVNTFPSKPIHMNWKCTCGQRNSVPYDLNANTVVLASRAVPEGFTLPSYKLLPEYNELVAKNPHLRPLYTAAMWLDAGDTIAQRILEMQSMPADRIDSALLLRRAMVHGLANKISGTCSNCGTHAYQAFTVDEQSFIRFD